MGAVVQSRNRIPPTCPCTSWGLAPIHVLQSLFPPLAREPEHPAALDSVRLWDFYSVLSQTFCCGVCLVFFSPSTLSHLSPVSLFLRLSFLVYGMMSTFLF